MYEHYPTKTINLTLLPFSVYFLFEIDECKQSVMFNAHTLFWLDIAFGFIFEIFNFITRLKTYNSIGNSRKFKYNFLFYRLTMNFVENTLPIMKVLFEYRHRNYYMFIIYTAYLYTVIIVYNIYLYILLFVDNVYKNPFKEKFTISYFFKY